MQPARLLLIVLMVGGVMPYLAFEAQRMRVACLVFRHYLLEWLAFYA